MRSPRLFRCVPTSCLALLALCTTLAATAVQVRTNGALIAEGMPEIPADLLSRVRRYGNLRSARLQGWMADGSMLISTRFAETTQIHQVANPLGARRQLTFFDEPVGTAAPQPGGSGFLYARDAGGSEFYQLYFHDLATGQAERVTDGDSRNGAALWRDDGQAFAYYSTRRNGRDWDLLLGTPDGRSPRTLLDVGGVGWFPEAFSADGRYLLATRYESINVSHPFRIDIEAGTHTPLLPGKQPAAIGTMAFTRGAGEAGSEGIVYTTDRDAEFMQLRYLARIGGRERVLAGGKWGVSNFALADDGRHLAWVTNEDGYSRLHLRTWPRMKRVRIADIPDGLIGGLEFSADSRQLAFTLTRPTAPADVYSLDLESRAMVRWTHSETAGLPPEGFVAPELVHYGSFDGLQIPAFVYRPPDTGAGPRPVLIDIHGGPEGQSRPGFSPRTQFLLAELGVVVIRPNVRGSNGYGKSWLRLDNGRLREDSVRDIGALLDWIAAQPDLDSSRVAVIGGSYGGYMVLASMARYGERLRAGVEIVGISNFVTFLTNTQDYRRDLRRAEYGDERDPEMRAFLDSISPLNHVERIKRPLLIAQGRNDPRVPESEGRQMVDALRAAGLPVWYLVATNEGHGFRRRRNSDYFTASVAMFLREYLLPPADATGGD